MKNTTRWMGLSLAALLVATGCKTPQLAWWKSSKSSESTTLAEAPVSPAEAAKQAEQIAPSSSQLVGNESPAFTPGATSPAATNADSTSNLAQATPVAPTSYPKTSAPAYTPENVAAAVSSGPPAEPGYDAAAGPIYDAGRPPQTPIATNTPAAPAPAPRYAPTTPTAPSPGTLVAAPTAPPGDAAISSRYGAPTGPSGSLVDNGSRTTNADSLPVYPGTGVGDVPPPATTPAPETMVSNEPYRPGGTSSYPGTVEMVAANPPAEPVSRYAPAPSDGAASPGTPPPQSSQRYW